MPVVWPLAKFLFKLVVPSLPSLVSTIATLKPAEPLEAHVAEMEQRLTQRLDLTLTKQAKSRDEPLQAHMAQMERRLSQQLERIETLTKQVEALHTILRRALFIGLVALGLSLTGLALFLFS